MQLPQFTYASRLNSFKSRPELFSWQGSPSSVVELIRRADQVASLHSIMLNYPEHFEHASPAEITEAVRASHLSVSGINLRYPPEFAAGAFTHPEAAKRQAAIQLTQEAADLCRQLDAAHLIVWLSNDGFDYPFQLDYARAWDWTVAGIRAIAEYAPDLKISIEYKPTDPRRYSLLGDMGTTLLALNECNRPNLGVTLDFCHLLMAHENPAMSAALCLRQNKLFGLHLNDGYRSLDDGLMVGAVNPVQTMELLYHVLRAGYAEVIYFDTFPVLEDPVAECAANIRRVNQMVEVTNRLDEETLTTILRQQDGLRAAGLIWEALFSK